MTGYDVTGYDVIGDVHGHVDVLERLLAELGYERSGGLHRRPEGRQAVFVGDLIDRGPGQLDTLRLVRAMVEVGAAQGGAGQPRVQRDRIRHAAPLTVAGAGPTPPRTGTSTRRSWPRSARTQRCTDTG